MLRQLNIRQKILCIVILPLILAAVIAVTAVLQLNHVAGSLKATINDEGLVATEYILNADRDLYQALNNIQEMAAMAQDGSRAAELLDSYTENMQQVTERLGLAEDALMADQAIWEKFTGPVNKKTIFDNFDTTHLLLAKWADAVGTLIGELRTGEIYGGTYLADFEEARSYINEITDTMKLALEDEMAAEMDDVGRTSLTMAGVSVAGFVLVLALTLLVTSGIVRSVQSAAGLIGELGKGHLSERVSVRDSERDEVAAMIRGMNGFADHLQHNVVGAMQRIARGDLGSRIEAVDDRDEIAPALQQTLHSLQSLVDDTRVLTSAAARGALDVRSDAGNLEGAYAEIVNGINATLDGIIMPINEARGLLGKMAVNDLGANMSDGYQGMLAELARDINQVRGNLLDIQDALVRSSRGDIGRLEEFERLGRRSDNDKLTPSLLAVYQSIRDITSEAGTLTEAALHGNLALRADLSRFQGGYRSIVDGFNKTIDALVRPIQDASAVIQQMAAGNLTVRMDGQYEGDHAVVKNSLNSALDAFNLLLGEIRRASEEVATGSQQLANSSQSLSQGATEQASSIEEISASIEELAGQTRRNAGNAGAASELSAQAKSSALQGNERMKAMLESMNSINESSSNISKIIKVIDDIAFQTNILALNAAVEAARAGQHGRGFAVVAEEVRSLAARSAEAAKETTLMIENSIRRVDDGTTIANGTAKALEEIVDKVGRTTELVMSISESSNDQASGIVQINEALTQVSRVVQMNSSAAEQSASASEELTGQAGTLQEMVLRFKLKN